MKIKTRFGTFDVACEVAELSKKLPGLRLSNIYDVDKRLFILKFGGGDDKILLVVESGVRLHMTRFSREKRRIPTVFVMKLRKHLRAKRLDSIRQLGFDRMVDLKFTSIEGTFHLILEFFAKGNVILTTAEYQVLALLRPLTSEDLLQYRVGGTIDISLAKTLPEVTGGWLRGILSASEVKGGDSLRSLLAMQTEYGPSLCEHCMRMADLPPAAKVHAALGDGGDELQLKLVGCFAELNRRVRTACEEVSKGYVTLSADGGYEEFTSILLAQHSEKKIEEFETFDWAVDAFFSKGESAKEAQDKSKTEDVAVQRLMKAKQQHEERLQELQGEEAFFLRCAFLIERNLLEVDDAIKVVRAAVAHGYDWADLKTLIKSQQKNGNPIALLISELKLDKNEITLLLCSQDFAASPQDEDEMSAPAETVDVDIGMSAHANIERFYVLKKKAAYKHQRTMETTALALRSATEKAESAASKKQSKQSAGPVALRKPSWYEKFHWFISTERYLVIAGRDAQQNEALVKRYLRPGDAFVHADVHGAAAVIVKNRSPKDPVPDMTLAQAGSQAVCRSIAWENRVVTSAWWVAAHQVSKTAPTGEYLPTGAFVIRGKKNFLPSVQLVLGLGVMFRLDDASLAARLAREKAGSSSAGASSSWSSSAVSSVETEEPLDEVQNDDPDEDDRDSAPSLPPKSATPLSPSSFVDEASRDLSPDVGSREEVTIVAAEAKSESGDDGAVSVSGGAADSVQKEDNPVSDAYDSQRVRPDAVAAGKSSGAGEGDVHAKEADDDSCKPSSKGASSILAHLPRGKRNKMKKLKKYRDQSDDERDIMLKSVGSKKMKEMILLERAAGVAREDVLLDEEVAAADRKRALEEERARAEKAKEREARHREEEEARQAMMEEGEGMLTAEDLEKLTEVDVLIAHPEEGEAVTCAVPVCGPYYAMSRFKFRVKLTPGTERKGRVCRDSMALFLLQDGASEGETKCIREIPEPEISLLLPSSVKMSSAGAHDLQMGRKARKKAAKHRPDDGAADF